MLVQGSVGQPAVSSIQAGANPTLRQGQMADVIVTELQGRYYENVYRGNTFSASNQAGVSLAATFAATASTCALSNPIGSGKNLVLISVGFAFSAAPAAATVVGLVGNFNGTTNVTHTTAITVQNTMLGGAVGVAKADSSATLPTAPVLLMPIAAVEAIGSITPQTAYVEVAGQIVIPPGGYVAIHASAATTGLGSFVWVEVPV